MPKQGERNGGWTLTELMAILAIIGILTSVAVASYAVAVDNSAEVTCQYNRACLRTALELYNNEHATAAESPSQLSPYVTVARALTCPAEGTYALDADRDDVLCTVHD